MQLQMQEESLSVQPHHLSEATKLTPDSTYSLHQHCTSRAIIQAVAYTFPSFSFLQRSGAGEINQKPIKKRILQASTLKTKLTVPVLLWRSSAAGGATNIYTRSSLYLWLDRRLVYLCLTRVQVYHSIYQESTVIFVISTFKTEHLIFLYYTP